MMIETGPCTAFVGARRFAVGALADVARAAREAGEAASPLLVFDDATGRVIDLDLRAIPAEAPVEPPSRGRPRLGVVAREVTLLPRHWEFLAAQPGGASVALRKLVEMASRNDVETGRRRRAQEAAYRFATAMAGDAPGYESAMRALFAGDKDGFADHSAGWAEDVRDHARALAADAFVPAP